MPEKVCIAFASGCPRSRVEIAKYFSYFKANGYEITKDFSSADVVIVSGCSVNDRNEKKSVKLALCAASKFKADAKFIITGCVAAITTPEKLPANAILLSPKDMSVLDTISKADVALSKVDDVNDIHENYRIAKSCFSSIDRFKAEFELSGEFLTRMLRILTGKHYFSKNKRADQKNVWCLKVANGCMEDCSYCAIKFAEGRLRSKPLDTIAREHTKGLEKGYRNFALIASDTGAYGQDIGLNIISLLRVLFSSKEKFSLHIKDFGPKWFVKYLTPLLDVFSQNSSRFASIMLPVQSGNDRILREMRRDYSVSEVKNALLQLRYICPGLEIATHIMVGFPGETESEFEETLMFLDKVNFDRIDVYKYSDRPGTEASDYHTKVCEKTKHLRLMKIKHFHKQCCVM